MMKFNLLPHRSQQRERRRQRFYGMLLLAALLGSSFTGIGWHAVNQRQDLQLMRNQWLEKKSRQLTVEIKQTAILQQQIASLVASAGKIKAWQFQRGRMPRFLNTLATQIPAGAYLQKMAQQDQKITLDGYVTSNQVVAKLLQNLNAQTHDITSAQLLETHAENRQRPSAPQTLAFSVAVTLQERP